jgi:signal peptidase I
MLAAALALSIGVMCLIAKLVVEGWTNANGGGGANGVAPFLALGVAQALAATLAIRSIVQTTAWRAFAIWLGGGLAASVTVIAANSFTLELVANPSCNMSPTIAGERFESACPRCGGVLMTPVTRSRIGSTEPEPGICASCLQESSVPVDNLVRTPDRLMINKLLTPQRWDIVVFLGESGVPGAPAPRWISRVVGLPGETVFVKEAAIWIDSAKVDLPKDIEGARYVTESAGRPLPMGTVENPLRLGPGEFCLLGDFSERSRDSRDVGPIKIADIVGVIGLRYWPPRRIKVFR